MKLLILTILASLLLTGCTGKYEGESAEFWYGAYAKNNSKLFETREALEEANYNIESANSNIDDAKYYSGGTYEDMESALDSLDTVETVDEP